MWADRQMTATERTADTIQHLAGSLTPVRRLPRPAWRTLTWVSGVAVLTAALAVMISPGSGGAGFAGSPFVLPSLVGSILSAVLAAFAAFQLSLPDRASAWALLPLPAVALWVVSSGLGCLAGLGEPATWGATLAEIRQCLTVILGASIPLSILLVVMLRQAFPLRPTYVALMGGLAVAAASGSVLLVLHPHNSTILDLAVHSLCVLAVIAANAFFGGRLLARL